MSDRERQRLIRLSGVFERLKEQGYPLLDTVLLGVAGALAAQLFLLLLRLGDRLFLTGLAGYTPPGTAASGSLHQVIGPHGVWLIPLVTTLGGLMSGFIVYRWAPEAEGHGTDTVVQAFHRSAGFFRARVPPLKTIASAITIGSGGSAGREGPTALITAGVGSVYGTLTGRTDEERRLLGLIGMAAGLSAIFRSPIGTAIFAVEVLYGGMEYEGGALLYTMLASVIAYAVNGLFVGYGPLFEIPAGLAAPGFFAYGWYVLLGSLSGIVATVLPTVFYGIRDLFRAIPCPPHIKPAIGGVGVGLIALWLPQVLGGGYGWIQLAIDGRLATGLMLVLVAGKMLAFALTVSSGGSGGVFAPSLYVGAMLGGAVASVFHQSPATFVVVGMGAVFGGAARVPVATLLMATEMTGGYQLLVPAALAILVSYLIQTVLSARSKYKSLYEEQVPSQADSPAHRLDYLETVLHLLGERRITVPADVAHLDLSGLLTSGIPVDLPGDKQMVLGTLEARSPYVGRLVQADFPVEAAGNAEVVAVFRRGRTLLPKSKSRLRAGDRVLLIASRQTQDRLRQHFAF